MSGHSKWATIKHKKGIADAKRGQKFTKLIKEISVAAKMGGSDPESNARLRTAVLKARAENMPKDNIDRAIKKGAGELDNSTYYELTYEGYAPGGVALIIDTLTDNKNRTASDVRSTLTKNGGTLGATGCVSYMFQTKGIITYDAGKYSEEQIFEVALENGADDVTTSDGVIEVITTPSDFANVLEAMQGAGFEQESAEVEKVADQTVTLESEKARKVLKIIDKLEELDDVQQVSSNLELPDDFEDSDEE
ncbi:putative transcriptional regulatory protein [bioreactor metagenome]|jgi:YebC/PmpR family DNA-binding regulatory protein|uniref:Putative transcriptional regulatory protein n=1 Tax=bioreactor metagenome TaxID=1076179 RepID=A0A644W224_9ZZZZ|nr:YebC/PmpR family DNA-binding transcriptional regulator [Sphaerochaeta associata]MDT3360162.1 YebC/PmpR family DNA-binding transcriptional regulator [Spirochaetota bacterium]MEA5030270.1 YebC/PmpR family DNA-binding transcriptional regulator [Sphaerochaeta associata]MEA5106678.1 YebC/PmpR family DNA-binding transcriptional regulator [Sphaerochaeta associata]